MTDIISLSLCVRRIRPSQQVTKRHCYSYTSLNKVRGLQCLYVTCLASMYLLAVVIGCLAMSALFMVTVWAIILSSLGLGGCMACAHWALVVCSAGAFWV